MSQAADPKAPAIPSDGFDRVVEETIQESKPSTPLQRMQLVGRKATPSAKPLPPIPQMSRPDFSTDLPRRSWFARTFVAPVERLLGGLARLVVTVFAIAIAGFVCLVVVTRFMPAPPAATPSTSVGGVTPKPRAEQSQPTAQASPISPPATRPANGSNTPHKGSLREKLYEKATGKEVVHRKDGTTFERKQPKR